MKIKMRTIYVNQKKRCFKTKNIKRRKEHYRVIKRLTQQKKLKDTSYLNIIKQMELLGTHRLICPQLQNTFFSSACGIHS